MADSLTLVDVVFVLILIGSIVLAAWRGVVREIISLVGWLVAIVCAWLYGPLAAHYMPIEWATPARLTAGYCAAFFGTLILAAVMGFAASRVVRAVGLGPVDRLFGAVFGVVRGVVVIVVVVALVGLTPWSRAEDWQQSALVPYGRAIVDVARQHLPNRPPVDQPSAPASEQPA